MPLNKSQLAAKQPTTGKLVCDLRKEVKLSQEKFAAELGVTLINFLLHQLGRSEVLRSKCFLDKEWRND